MLTKISIFILIVTMLFAGCKAQSFKRISKQIERATNQKKRLSQSHYSRIKLFEMGKLDFINLTHDTIYLLQSSDIESGNLLCKIWNKSGGVEYSYYDQEFDLNSRPYTRYTAQLIQAWDTIEIRKEEKIHSSFNHRKGIAGMRVILHHLLQSIDVILFQEFFDFDRDRD